MSYSEPLINQIRVFFLSIGMGVPLCLIYSVLQGLAAFFGKNRWAVYLTDSLFCAFAALISFFFMVLYNNGRVRLHLIFGETIGFFVFYLSVGKYLLRLCVRLCELLGKGAAVVLYPFRRVGRALVNSKFTIQNLKLPEKLRVKGKAAGAVSSECDFGTALSPSNQKYQKSNKKIRFIGKIHLKNKNKSV